MFADDDCVWLFAPQLPKDLRALAVKALAKLDVRWDRLRPPVAFNLPIFFTVAHEIGRALEHRNLACEAPRRPRLVRISSRRAKCPRAPPPGGLCYYVGTFPDA